jgi:lysozyme
MIDHPAVTARLLADEGEVLHAYADHRGFLTIGVGRLIDERRGGGISVSESRFLLHNDIDKRVLQAVERFPWFRELSIERRGVIVCMAFQLGINGVANFRRMCAAIEAGDFEAAATEMRMSTWAVQTPSRSARLARIMRTSHWE